MNDHFNKSFSNYDSCSTIVSSTSSIYLNANSCSSSNCQNIFDSQFSFCSINKSNPDSCTSCYNSPNELEYIKYTSSLVSKSMPTLNYSTSENLNNVNSKKSLERFYNSTETICYDSEATHKLNQKKGLSKSFENFANNELSLSVNRLPKFLQKILKNQKIDVIEVTDQIDLKSSDCFYYNVIFTANNEDCILPFTKNFYQSQNY
uniref:Ras-associating domain-containing protein n=1 Tax=Strongyloides stercoralis TaxID=6248 RepID=A0A0K0EQZ9_STRER